MKKIKCLILSSFLLFSLFGCKKNIDEGINIDEEVKSIIIEDEVIDVTVGDVINIEKYLYFENAVDFDFKVELTKGSKGLAYISETNNHVVEFLQEGLVLIKITTNNGKTATLKFNCYSKLKNQFLDYLKDIDYNYGFVTIKANSDEDGNFTYDTVDYSSTLLSTTYRTVHNNNYFIYYSDDSYKGYLQNGKDNQVYAFECDDASGKNLNVLPSYTGNKITDYRFSSKYSIDSDLISTRVDMSTHEEYLYVDLSSSIDLASSIVSGPLGLIDYRKNRFAAPITNDKRVLQADHINIEFKDVQYININGDVVALKMPVYSLYYKVYIEAYPNQFSYAFVGEYYGLVNLNGKSSTEIDKYISSNQIPGKLVDDTMRESISPLLKYKNYTLTVTGRWMDSDYYYLFNEFIPKSGNIDLFPSFAYENKYSETKVQQKITYPLVNNKEKTYIFISNTGKSEEYVGNFIEDADSYSLSYFKENNEDYILITQNYTGVSYRIKLNVETIDSSSFYGSFNFLSKDRKYLFTNDNKGKITIKDDDKVFTTLSYQGNGIKYYNNLNDDGSLSSVLLDKGYALKDGILDTETDVLINRNPLLDLYNYFDDRIELQKIETEALESETYGRRIKTSFNFAKVNSLVDVFKHLLLSNYENLNIGDRFLTYYSNIRGETFKYFDYFSPEIYTVRNEDTDEISNIVLDFTFTYSTIEDKYYHVIFNFSSFNTTEFDNDKESN